MSSETSTGESLWLRIIYILSAVIAGAVAFLILGPRPEGLERTIDVSFLPTVNAILNGLTALLLVLAYILIRRKKVLYHRRTMLSAFGTSALFLVTYITYHWFKSGPTPYAGTLTLLYYPVLLSHIVLAALILPLAMVTLYRGWNLQVSKHRRIARITLPLWLYVCLSGIAVYIMLYR